MSGTAEECSLAPARLADGDADARGDDDRRQAQRLIEFHEMRSTNVQKIRLPRRSQKPRQPS